MKEIIILGMGNSRVECPFDAETWGVNNGYRQVVKLKKGKLDKLFIAHQGQEYDFEGDPVFNFDELNALINKGVEIVSLFKVKELKNVTRLPFKQMCDRFKTEFYSDTIAYMIAYALYQHTQVNGKGLIELTEPLKLRMYGVDLYTQDEYATEKGGVEYFVAVARTIGVDFWVHPDSTVCKTVTGKPYGFWRLPRKKIDPYNVMKLQRTPRGLKRMLKLGLITTKQYEQMVEILVHKDSSDSLLEKSK